MRTLRALIDVFRKPDASQRELEDAAHEADLAATAAEAEMAAAETAYRAGLLGDEKQLAKLDDARRAAALKRDRARALTDELDRRIMAADAESNRARRQAMHDDAKAKCDAIAKRLAVEYPKHAAALRSLLHDLAEAEFARERAMAEVQDLGWIAPPEEVVRGLDGVPEEIVSRDRVELWVLPGQSIPLPAERQKEVEPDRRNPKRGTLPYQSDTNAGAWTCALRPFDRVVFREAVADPRLESLLQTVSLPAFYGLAEPYVTAMPYRDADMATRHFAGPIIEAAPSKRGKQIRFEPIPDPPAAPAREAA